MMRFLPLAFSACLLAACNQAPEQVSVTDAVVQLPAAAGRPGAAYFTLHGGSEDARLASVSTDRADRAELHETVMEGNVTRMGPLRDNIVPAGGEMKFEPGGKHVMLFGLDPALAPGDKVKMTVTFESRSPLTVDADVRAFGGGHSGH